MQWRQQDNQRNTNATMSSKIIVATMSTKVMLLTTWWKTLDTEGSIRSSRLYICRIL
jgi:hypothetical protein